MRFFGESMRAIKLRFTNDEVRIKHKGTEERGEIDETLI